MQNLNLEKQILVAFLIFWSFLHLFNFCSVYSVCSDPWRLSILPSNGQAMAPIHWNCQHLELDYMKEKKRKHLASPCHLSKLKTGGFKVSHFTNWTSTYETWLTCQPITLCHTDAIMKLNRMNAAHGHLNFISMYFVDFGVSMQIYCSANVAPKARKQQPAQGKVSKSIQKRCEWEVVTVSTDQSDKHTIRCRKSNVRLQLDTFGSILANHRNAQILEFSPSPDKVTKSLWKIRSCLAMKRRVRQHASRAFSYSPRDA